MNFEASYVPATYDAGVWGSEIRPVATWTHDRFEIAINPIVTFSWTGRDAGVPHFEPAAAVTYAFDRVLSLGLEYYGAVGALDNVPPVAQQSHYLFEVVEVLGVRGWEIQFGIGEGLTPASNTVVFKSIIGHTF